MKKNGKKKSRFGFLLSFVIKIAFFAAAIWAVLTYLITFHRVTDNNMFPNVKSGDLCIISRLEESNPGDIVLYKNGAKLRLGRITAMEEQEVDFPEEGGYLVNGYIPSEEITYQTFKDPDADMKYPLTVEKDTFFIMNDFRSDTKDSRKYGVIKKEDIIGNIIFILRRRGF